MKKILFISGLFVLINLNYSLFFKNNNIFDFLFLNSENNLLINKIETLEKKNNDLSIKIKELSSSSHALENFARYNLGLVKNDEIFVHVIKK
jgi:cell division protein FtsB